MIEEILSEAGDSGVGSCGEESGCEGADPYIKDLNKIVEQVFMDKVALLSSTIFKDSEALEDDASTASGDTGQFTDEGSDGQEEDVTFEGSSRNDFLKALLGAHFPPPDGHGYGFHEAETVVRNLQGKVHLEVERCRSSSWWSPWRHLCTLYRCIDYSICEQHGREGKRWEQEGGE